MALIHGVKPIVTSGLVLCLDAGNRKSYPGSGDIWTDLSGNGNTGSINGGAGYSNLNGGSLTFDGTNDDVGITNNDLYKFSNTQAFSLNLWVKCTSPGVNSGTNVVLAFANGGRGYYFTIDINFIRTNSFFFDYYDGSIFRGIQGNNNSITLNSWVMLTATSSSNSVNGMKVYQNGVLTSWTNRGTGTPSTINYDTLSMKIGSRQNAEYFVGNISQASIYNRALSAAEIAQNYDALKGRYGLT